MLKVSEGLRLTNYDPSKTVSFGALDLIFSYKRDDLTVKNLDQVLKYFTPVSLPNSFVFLTNSGQIGLSLVLHFFKHQLKLNSLTSFSPLYTGAVDVIKLLEMEIKTSGSNILWICSSTFSMEQVDKIYSQTWEYVVIDSTCWSLREESYLALLKRIKFRHLIQIRSLSKLDMGGVEYGSLGSLIISSQEEFDLTPLSKLYRVMGAAPSLCDISPDLFLEESFEKNLVRCEKIVENTLFIESHLQPVDKINLEFPEHKKYFFIICDKEQFSKESDLKLNTLALLLTEFGVDFKCVKSFGFNFWNFDYYLNPNIDSFVLRVAVPPVLDREEVKKVIFCLNKYMRSLS